MEDILSGISKTQTQPDNILAGISKANLEVPTSPITTAERPDIGESKYDVGVFPANQSQLEEIRAQNQSKLAKLGAGAINSVTQTAADILAGTGYLLDFDQHYNTIKGTEQEFGNWFSDSVNKLAEKTKVPVYRTKASEGFHPESAGWWGDIMPSFVSSLALLFPAEGATALLGKGLKEIGGIKAIKAIDSALGIGSEAGLAKELGSIHTVGLSRIMESTMEAGQTFKETEEKLKNKVNPKTGQLYTPEEIKNIAGEAARSNYYANLPMVLNDLAEYKLLFKGWKGAKAAQKASKEFGIGSLIKNSGLEGTEELAQGITNAEAQHAALVKAGAEKDSSFADRLSGYLKDGDMWTAAFAGALGGAMFQIGGSAIEKHKQKSADKAQELADTTRELHQAILEGNKEKFNKVSDVAFAKATIDHIQKGDIDKFKEDLVNLSKTQNDILEGQDFNDPSFYNRINQRIQDLDFFEEQYHKISDELETTPEIKALKLSTTIDQRLIQKRINAHNESISKLNAEDIKEHGVPADLAALKALKTEYLAKLDLRDSDKRVSAKEVEELGKKLDQAYKDYLTLSNKYDELDIPDAKDEVDKLLVSPTDNELQRVTMEKIHEELDLKEAKETLKKLSNKSEVSKIQKDIEAKKVAEERASQEQAEKARQQKVKETVEKYS